MQESGQFNLPTSPTVQKWHPKLTPYRLLALGTTISVGTAKAIVTQEGESNASTTLEWISGVIIFLILYTMSTYEESPKTPPPPMGWLFHIDCMDYIWRALFFVRIPCPSYSSELELISRLNEKGYQPVLVTQYRLIVSVTTVCFGLIKATLTYTGYSSGANWVNWTVGAVTTSILFIIGLYENNTVGIWHTFFILDHGTETVTGLELLGVTTVHTPWIWVSFGMIEDSLTEEYSRFLFIDGKPVLLIDLTSLLLLRERLFTACLVLCFAFLTVLSIGCWYGAVAAVLSTPKLPRWQIVAGSMLDLFQRPVWSDRYVQSEPPGRRLGKKIAYRTVILTTFLLGCAVFLAFWVVSIAANVKEGYATLHSDSGPNGVHLGSLAVAMLFQLCCARATGFLMWLTLWKVLLPPR